MPSGDTTVYEAITLIACILAFEIWERVRPGRPIDRVRHLRLDVFAFVVVMVVGTLWKALLVFGFDAVDLRRVLAALRPVHELPSAAKVAIGIVLADFCLYWVHRAMHGPDILWRTHQFHHSIEELYWLSGARTSVTHLLLFAIPQVLIANFLLALTPVELAVAFSIGVLVNLWVHTNLRVHLGPLEWLIITPEFHRAHHARDIMPSRNLGFLLTVWDRLFGTYLDPWKLPRDYKLGLAQVDAGLPRMIAGV